MKKNEDIGVQLVKYYDILTETINKLNYDFDFSSFLSKGFDKLTYEAKGTIKTSYLQGHLLMTYECNPKEIEEMDDKLAKCVKTFQNIVNRYIKDEINSILTETANLLSSVC